MREKLVDLGAKQESIRVVMLGIDKNLFPEQTSIFKQKDIKKFVVGSIRNLHPVYDMITFLKAAKIVLNKRQDVIFGGGSGRTYKPKKFI